MVTLTLASGSGTAGGSITLNLSIVSSLGDQCTGVEFIIAPSVSTITLTSVSLGAAATSANKTLSRAGGLCIVQSIGINNDVIPDGVLVTATFSIATNASGTNIINLLNIFATNANADSLSTGWIAGAINLPGVTQKGNKGRTHIHKPYSAAVSAASAA